MLVTSWFPLPVTSGGRKRCTRLIEAMQAVGLEPEVVTSDYPEATAISAAEARGWRVHELHGRPSVGRRIIGRLSGGLAPPSPADADRLRELSTGAAFVQLEEIGALRWRGARPPDVPLIVSSYNVDSIARNYARNRRPMTTAALSAAVVQHRMAAVERCSVRAAVATLCVSAEDAAHFRSRGARNTVLVANGVDDEFFAVPADLPRTDTVLFFGQLEYRPNAEGVIRFIEAGWPVVRNARPHAELRVVGHRAGPQVHAAASRADGVQVVGFVEDLARELADTRVVVAPIRSGGGTRLKVLEALAAARPVVGTPLGVERIGFEHGRHGFAADADEDIARYLVRILTDERLAAEQGNAGRKLAQSYRWSTALTPVRDLYQRLQRSAPSRPPS